MPIKPQKVCDRFCAGHRQVGNWFLTSLEDSFSAHNLSRPGHRSGLGPNKSNRIWTLTASKQWRIILVQYIQSKFQELTSSFNGECSTMSLIRCDSDSDGCLGCSGFHVNKLKSNDTIVTKPSYECSKGKVYNIDCSSRYSSNIHNNFVLKGSLTQTVHAALSNEWYVISNVPNLWRVDVQLQTSSIFCLCLQFYGHLFFRPFCPAQIFCSPVKKTFEPINDDEKHDNDTRLAGLAIRHDRSMWTLQTESWILYTYYSISLYAES